MKYYAIYQHFVNEKFDEVSLLVAKVKAKNKGESIKKYVTENVKEDSQDFVEDFLHSSEISLGQFNLNHDAIIEKNLKRLGFWAH